MAPAHAPALQILYIPERRAPCMAMPAEVDLRLPVLGLLADGGVHRIAEVTDRMADRFGLGEEERSETYAVSGRPKFGMRVRHAVSQLRIADYLSNTEAGSFAITRAGRAALESGAACLTNEHLLSHSTAYRLHKDGQAARTRALGGNAGAPVETEGMVAILDVLGTKGQGGPEDHARLHDGWRDLLSASQRLIECSGALSGRCTLSAFSDTMFVTAASPGPAGGGPGPEDMLIAFSDIAWRLVVRSIEDDVPVRGCVSYGRYYTGARNLFTGSAVDEAARYHELPQWIGVSAAPSANRALSKAIRRRSDPRNRFYTRYDIPLGSSVERDAWVVNWPRQYDNEEPGEAMENVLERIDGKLDGITDVDAALKWRNTRKFCTDMLAE